MSEDPLASALSEAFTSSPSLRPEPQPDTPAPAHSTSTAESSVSSDSVTDSSDSEYEAYVAEWRAQSAEAREKAEKERARWESIRAVEKREAALQNPMVATVDIRNDRGVSSDQEWETVGDNQAPGPSSPSPVDSRDLVTGEPQKNVALQQEVESTQKSHSAPDTAEESQKWEDVSSHLTSSFPSLSFPDTDTPPPPSPPPPPATLESATLAIFDPSLSTRTRVTALFSSLAINFLLPFVNGVMLGFGEIFAKNIVLDYFGWRPVSQPGLTAASTGLGASLRPRGTARSSKTNNSS